MNDDISGWNQWSESFADWTDITISELHGIVSALMTTCEAAKEEIWQQVFEELSFSPLSQDALTLICEEAEDICFQLKDKDDAYAYSPLLPDDEHDLYERVVALKNWAGGFITGIGICDAHLSDNELQALSDLSRIAAIRIHPEDEFEGGEESFLHLYEFARMVPVSFSVRKRKAVSSLRLIAGLSVHDKTATELANEQNIQSSLPPIVDAMSKPH